MIYRGHFRVLHRRGGDFNVFLKPSSKEEIDTSRKTIWKALSTSFYPILKEGDYCDVRGWSRYRREMSEQQNQRWPSSAAEDKQHPPKRRKIRKGTLSCWECKRRKTRCSYAAPSNKKCDGCRSRRTKCISQEFRDEADDRVDHEESPTVQLTRHSDDTGSNASIQYQPDQERITLPAVRSLNALIAILLC